MNDKVTDKGAVALDEDVLDAAAGGVSKIDAITIKQKVSETGRTGIVDGTSNVAGPHVVTGATIKQN